MKPMYKIIVLGLGLLTSTHGWGQVNSFTLEEAKAHALEHHLDIIKSQGNVDFAQQQIVETRGIGLPQIDFSGQFNHFINIPVSVVDASLFNPAAPPGEVLEFRMGQEFSTSGTLQVNQLIFNGSYIVGLQAMKFVKRFQESAYLATKEDVVFNVIQAYQLATIAKGNIVFADSMVILTEQMVEAQQHYFDLDLILQEDIDQLNYSLLTARNAALSAHVQYENALNLLKFSMGYSMSEEIEISESAEQLITKTNLSSGDIKNNLQYSLAQQNVTLTKLDVKNTKFENLPSLYAFFSQAYNAYRNEFNFFADERWYPQTVWGLQLNVPIFSGLQRHARTKQKKIKLMQDQNAVEQLERALQFQEIQTKNNLRAAKDKFELQSDNTALAKMIYKNAVEVKEIGKGNSITVTQKHNQMMMAQAQYLGSLMELFQAQLELDKLYNEILSKNQ
jgi:outer membrane protein TolC